MDQESTQPAFGQWDEEKLAEAAEKSKLLRALFSNQIYIQPDGLHLRLTFGERVAGEALFHTAVVVPNADALEFGQLLTAMAQASIDQQVEAMRQTFGTPTEDQSNDQ